MRYVRWLLSRKFATKRIASWLPYRVMAHKSLLLRKLGTADMRLQRNKVKNLDIAARCIDGIVIRPGETFSLWRLVGRPTARRGYLPGMLLSNGQVIEGVGGGLCQLANLLYWMALHSPLTVTERYRHSFDVFPDSGRVLPFGSGATIFYNYLDLALRNDTLQEWQIRVWVGEEYLHGELRTHDPWPYSYKVLEKDHAFYKDVHGQWRRRNKLFRATIDKKTGSVVREDLATENDSLVMYEPNIIA